LIKSFAINLQCVPIPSTSVLSQNTHKKYIVEEDTQTCSKLSVVVSPANFQQKECDKEFWDFEVKSEALRA
jgi:hypothetical protein